MFGGIRRGTESGLGTKNLRAKVMPLLHVSLQFESSNRFVQSFQNGILNKCVSPEFCLHTVDLNPFHAHFFWTVSQRRASLRSLLIANYALADPHFSNVIGLDKYEARENGWPHIACMPSDLRLVI